MENKGITIEIDYEKLAKALTDLIDQRIDKYSNSKITLDPTTLQNYSAV